MISFIFSRGFISPGSVVDLSEAVILCSLLLPPLMLRHLRCLHKTQGGCGMLKVELILVHLLLLLFEPRCYPALWVGGSFRAAMEKASE